MSGISSVRRRPVANLDFLGHSNQRPFTANESQSISVPRQHQGRIPFKDRETVQTAAVSETTGFKPLILKKDEDEIDSMSLIHPPENGHRSQGRLEPPSMDKNRSQAQMHHDSTTHPDGFASWYGPHGYQENNRFEGFTSRSSRQRAPVSPSPPAQPPALFSILKKKRTRRVDAYGFGEEPDADEKWSTLHVSKKKRV